jgi:DNA-binding transcriptional MerR regulator
MISVMGYGIQGQGQLIKKWTAAGVSLDRIRELLQGEQAPVPPRQKTIGSVEVCSHLVVADGIEVVIESSRACLTPEQVRHFIKGVMAVFAQVTGEQAADSTDRQKQKQAQVLKGNEK